MSFLRALTSTARMIRHAPEPGAGLPGDDQVLLDVPDERLGPALVAAALGDHGPAAALLAATREGAEWEDRDRYTVRLATFAHSRQDWLDSWLAAAPHHPDALLVKAELSVRRLWDSPARAERLRDAAPLIEAAADAAPRDPVPWRIALDHARGTRAAHTAFEELWAQAVNRSAHHYGCHVSALQYLSAQWYGSHRECFDFAEQAAEDALPGSLVQALPVRAAFAHLLSGAGSARPAAVIPYERVDAAADLAIALSAEYAAGDPWPAEVRNLLVYVLAARGRWAEALEQFRLIGPYVTSFPWAHLSDDVLGEFLELRDAARIRVASAMPLRPLRRTARRIRPDGHYA